MHFLKIYDKLHHFSPFAGCTNKRSIDQYRNITRWGGVLSMSSRYGTHWLQKSSPPIKMEHKTSFLALGGILKVNLGLILRKYWPTSNITLRKIIFFLKWNNITLFNSSLECLNMLRDGSIEEEILITIQQADDTGAVVCGGSNHLQSVSTLKVRLDHFVVLPIT